MMVKSFSNVAFGMPTNPARALSLYDLARIFGLPTNIAKKAEVRCGMDMITSDVVICAVVIYIKNYQNITKRSLSKDLSIYLSI